MDRRLISVTQQLMFSRLYRSALNIQDKSEYYLGEVQYRGDMLE